MSSTLQQPRRPLRSLLLSIAVLASTGLSAKDENVDPGVVPDQYIVVFADEAIASKSSGEIGNEAKVLVERIGGDLKATYSAALKGFAVRATKQQAEALAADPAIAKIIPDVWMEPTGSQDVSSFYHLDRSDQPMLPLDLEFNYDSPRLLGQGVTVYVMDGAIHSAHPDFGDHPMASGRVLPGVDFTGLGNQPCNNPSPYDDNHGTQVAGIAVGLGPGHAKAAKLQSLRVLDCVFSSTLSTFLNAVDWLTRNAQRPSVVNVSVSFNREATFFFPVEQINLATEALQRSISTGLIYVTASANRFPDAAVDASTYFPASVPEVITVGASDEADNRAPFSNYGPLVDLHAPGVNVRSSTFAPNTYGEASGTSFAAPAVSGTVARFLGVRPFATQAEIEQLLIDNATAGQLGNVGPGSANRLLYSRWIQESTAEDCTFSAWSTVHGQIETGPADDALGFSRVLSPCGIRADGAGAYLEKSLKYALDEYSARFYVIPDGGTSATIFRAFDASGAALFDVRLAGAALTVTPADGSPSWVTPLRADGWNSIELRWRAGANGALTADVGYLVNSGSWSTVTSTTTLQASGGQVKRVEWGMIKGRSTQPLRLAAFVSKYGVDTPIGRVCRCDANLDGTVSAADLDAIDEELNGQRAFGHIDCNEDGVVSKADIEAVNAILNSREGPNCPV